MCSGQEVDLFFTSGITVTGAHQQHWGSSRNDLSFHALRQLGIADGKVSKICWIYLVYPSGGRIYNRKTLGRKKNTFVSSGLLIHTDASLDYCESSSKKASQNISHFDEKSLNCAFSAGYSYPEGTLLYRTVKMDPSHWEARGRLWLNKRNPLENQTYF